MARYLIILVVVCLAASVVGARAEDAKVLTASAMKPVLLAVADDFHAASGHTMSVDNDTVGALVKRIQGGVTFDVAILTPAADEEPSKAGKIVAAGELARGGGS